MSCVGCVRPGRAEIIELAGELLRDEPDDKGRVARLSVVRYLNDEDGEEERVEPPREGLRKLEGQHQLLGWAMERDVLEFLLAAHGFVEKGNQ